MRLMSTGQNLVLMIGDPIPGQGYQIKVTNRLKALCPDTNGQRIEAQQFLTGLDTQEPPNDIRSLVEQ